MKVNKEQRSVIFLNLPKDIKDVFLADETTSYLRLVGESCQLSKKERSSLGESVGLVLLGIVSAENLKSHLSQRLDKDEPTIEKITKGVKKHIFGQISEELNKLDPQKILKEAESAGKQGESENIPVPPPPPEAGTPSPSYGGVTDPYQEPKE